MALLDIFKKKKKFTPKPPKKMFEAKSRTIEPAAVKARSTKLSGKKISETAYRVLKEPQVTEKATDLTQKNQYVFKVFPRVNKFEVKKAIEDLYGADVLSVKIINVPRKKRRLGRIEGWRKGYKKAIVRLKGDQKIEVLPR